ncbi:MAG: DUF2399 domain-containing protein [Treponema sp.]|nr:DUF2399 domain-containing protein [Treponema sp.]
MKNYSATQKQILQKLLAKYESSKSYRGENTVTQNFSIKPSDVFRTYEKDSADINEIEDFEKQCNLLEPENLVRLEWKYGRIAKISAVASKENWNAIREILCVKDKNERIAEEIFFYSEYCNDSSSCKIVKDFCTSQIERLVAGKKAEFSQEEAKNIIALLSFILKNKSEILERELSISVLANSKSWEEKYKRKVLKVLRQNGYFDSLIENCADEKEMSAVILEECNVFANPSYVYFRGNGTITLENGNVINVSSDMAFALSSPSINKISMFEISDSKIMTVENLTSFNRLNMADTFLIFLSGYHNSAKQNLLKKIYSQNTDKEYYHFGDIDPDGFFILKNLCAKTNINFKPYKMGVIELEKYTAFAKPLEENDITKAKSLIEEGLYVDVLNYMLENNIKLEQEIISWKNSSD